MGKRIEPFGTYKGKYMSFEEYLKVYPKRDEVKHFLRGQEVGRSNDNPDETKKLVKELENEFGSIEVAIEKFKTATANILKDWVPGKVREGGSFESLINYASTKDGIDLRKIESQEGRYGSNGGRGCDVLTGPCSCGAWH